MLGGLLTPAQILAMQAQIAQGTTAAPVETAAERVVRLRDEGMAQQAAERERHIQENPLAAFTPRVYSDATINFVNPYFTNSGPREDRFDYTQTGSGVTGTQNPALWFDQLFGSPFAPLADTPPASADIPGSDTHKIMAGPTLGGRSGGRDYVELMWGEQAAANTEYNLDVLGARGSLNSSLADSMFTDALAAAGISPSDYASMDAINALDPRKKLQFLDIYTRMQEEKNQLPPRGISSSLGGFGGLLATGLGAAFGGPFGGALMGGFTGGLQPGGGLDLLGGATDALSGFSLGEALNMGITNPFTGQRITSPIMYSSSSGSPFVGLTGRNRHGGYGGVNDASPGSSAWTLAHDAVDAINTATTIADLTGDDSDGEGQGGDGQVPPDQQGTSVFDLWPGTDIINDDNQQEDPLAPATIGSWPDLWPDIDVISNEEEEPDSLALATIANALLMPTTTGSIGDTASSRLQTPRSASEMAGIRAVAGRSPNFSHQYTPFMYGTPNPSKYFNYSHNPFLRGYT